MPVNVELEIVRSIVELSRKKEFYGHIIQQFQRVMVDNSVIPTAAVGKREGERFIKLFLNRSFFLDLLEKNNGNVLVGGVLEHEILHIALSHLFIVFDDHERGNVAKDLAVNSFIQKDSLPSGALYPEMFKLETERSARWYYNQLADNKKFKEMSSSGCFSGICKEHSLSDGLPGEEITKEFVKDLVRKAKEIAEQTNRYGNIPAGVLSSIEDLLKNEKPIIPWARVLRMFVASCSESVLDYTQKRISKRYGTRPGTRKEDVLNIAVGIDTSGSISNKALSVFFNEVKWIWKNGASVTVFECDCEIQSKYKFKGRYNGNVKGRGGTDLNPVLKETEGKYDALIYFTDFFAPEVPKYRIPTLWVLNSDLSPEQYPAKWGRVVKIGDGVPGFNERS